MKKPLDRGAQSLRDPEYDCDALPKDGSDEVCMREFLRAHMPLTV